MQYLVLGRRKIETIQSGIYRDNGEYYREKVHIEILSREDSDEVIFELVEDSLHDGGILALNLALK